jgi:hypothetical protein
MEALVQIQSINPSMRFPWLHPVRTWRHFMDGSDEGVDLRADSAALHFAALSVPFFFVHLSASNPAIPTFNLDSTSISTLTFLLVEIQLSTKFGLTFQAALE